MVSISGVPTDARTSAPAIPASALAGDAMGILRHLAVSAACAVALAGAVTAQADETPPNDPPPEAPAQLNEMDELLTLTRLQLMFIAAFTGCAVVAHGFSTGVRIGA
jgi:hypothetical protein